MCTIGTDCELTESVIFQPADQIQTSKSSWIFTTAVDFTPYLETISNAINYGINFRQALMDFTTTFNREDPRYKKLLNMTFDDLNLALNDILLIQTEASNLIGHIHNRNKRSFVASWWPAQFPIWNRRSGLILMQSKLTLNSCTKPKWIRQMYSMT